MTKKITISLLILVLCLTMAIGLTACNKDFGSLPIKLEYGADNSVARLTGDKTAEALSKNPNRGFSIDLAITLDKVNNAYGNTYAFPTCNHPEHQDGNSSIMTYDYMTKVLEKYKGFNANVVILTCYLTNFEKEALPNTALDQLNSFIRVLKDKNMSVVLKFAYEHGGNNVKPEIKNILTHMQNIAEFIRRNTSQFSDAVNAIRLSFIGEDGNFVESGYSNSDIDIIIDAFATMLPAWTDLYSQAPSVAIKNSANDYSKLIRMGFFNDYMDNIPNKYTSGGTSKNSDAYKQYVYQSELTFNSLGIMPKKNDINGKAILKQMKDGYFSTLDLTDICRSKDAKSLVEVWKTTQITKKDLDSFALPYYDEWFTNSDGSSANRYVFDYLRDFLGYNLSVTNLKITKDKIMENGKEVIYSKLSFVLTNYGMASPKKLTDFYICIKNNATGNFIKGGSKIGFDNYDPELLVSGGQIKFEKLIRGDIDIALVPSGSTQLDPSVGHSIGVGLYQDRSPRDLYVRLSNNIPFDGKVNWIYSTKK